MKNRTILIMCGAFVFLATIFAPVITLYLLEDSNVYYLNGVTLDIMKEGTNKADNPIINTAFLKYNGTKYDVSTFDSYEYPILDKVIDGKHYINDTLSKLKELESIGLLKNDFFLFLALNDHIITRTNEFYGDTLSFSNKRLFLSNDNFETAFMSFEVENISGKIIGLKIGKDYIVNEKEVLSNYIDYLDLKSDDWIFFNNSIISKVNSIEIKIENINNLVSISIVPYL